MARRRRPLLRASVELANAVNGVRPFGRDGYLTIPAFFAGWPTTEMAPLYMAGSMLGAVVRWIRGDYTDRRGRIALLLKVITWGLLFLIHRRNVASEPYFEDPLRETLGDDYEAAFRLIEAYPKSLLNLQPLEDFLIGERNGSTLLR